MTQSEHESRLTQLFFDRPVSWRLYQAAQREIEAIGPVEIGVTKTQVSFRTNRQFAWVWLPQLWSNKRPHDSIVLSFSLARRVDHPRIAESVEPYPGRWMHHVIIQDEAELDDEVRAWLEEAYAFASAARRRKS